MSDVVERRGGPDKVPDKVKGVRGGSWDANLLSARSTNPEGHRSPSAGYHSVGFRVVAVMIIE